MRFSARFYWLFVLVGIVFLASVLLVAYLDTISLLGILGGILVFLSPNRFGFFLGLVGIAFLTVGIVGIKRQFFRSHGTFLQAFSGPLISFLLFFTFVFVVISIYFSAPMYPMRSEITQVAVVDTDPLILNLHVRAITSSDTRIQSALVLNDTELVAQIPSEEEWADENFNFFSFTLAELPAGAEIALTLNFDTTLPSGSYLVRLSGWRNNHGESFFTIP